MCQIRGMTPRSLPLLGAAMLALVAPLMSCPIAAQRPDPPPSPDQSAAELHRLVSGLTVTARVLVIGMHPEDEDTELITWLARGHHVETAYLSITRGEAGPNYGGDESGSTLGAIRTQATELIVRHFPDGIPGQVFVIRLPLRNELVIQQRPQSVLPHLHAHWDSHGCPRTFLQRSSDH